MISIRFEEHCPYCQEDVSLEVEDGDGAVEYTCECGAQMEFDSTTKSVMTWSGENRRPETFNQKEKEK